MANFTGLAAGRDAVLRRAGWDVAARGLAGAPQVRVLVGAERHDTVDLALRYLGLGAPEVVPADEQGRVRAERPARDAGGRAPGPTIVCLQAGNIHSGAFDPFAEIIPAARAAGAWVHVDGAFGLWAAANPGTRELVAGVDGADSWATDAHKTLNVPYDSGLAMVRDPAAIRAAMSIRGDYLIPDETHRTRTSGCRSCRAAAGRWRSGRPCVRWVAPGWRSWSTGSAGTPPRSPDGRRCSRGDRAQRRGLHPGVPVVRLRPAYPGGGRRLLADGGCG